MKKTVYLLIPFLLILFSCKQYDAVQRKIVEYHQDSVKIKTVDGETYRGKALLPRSTSKMIAMKMQDNSIIEVPSEKIDVLSAWHKEQTNHLPNKFVYSDVEEYKTLDTSSNTKVEKRAPRWLYVLYSVKDVTIYAEHQGYNLSREGIISGHDTGVASNPPTIWYYIKKGDEETPVRIAKDASAGSASRKYFKHAGQKYFADCPPLVKKIKNEELTSKDIEKVAKLYCELREGEK